jgi:hypothetical protein
MYGTAGTAPFGTANDLSDIAQIYKLLDDNGTPKSDRHIVYNTTASANIRGKQAVLFKVNEAGTDSMLRGGTLGSLQGFEQHESNQIASHTKGTGASYTTDTAGYAVGATAITLITGTGTVLAGDTVTFAGDTNKYTVATALTGGVVKLAEPGLRVAIATSATAMTVGNNYIPSVAFERGAIHLLTRTPLMPAGGDSATDTMVVTDPYSGLSFLVAVYPQYHQSVVEIGLAWGQKAVKRDFIATLLG